MKIRNIEVKDYRKLRHVRVSDLRDGVNVIAGENEVGKSTLLSGVQTALFQRHNVGGKVLAAMQPFGSAVRPQIRITFEMKDGLYTLHKTFGGSGAAELVMPNSQRFQNQDADRKLEELLCFQSASRGATDFSSLGIWPLFWIEQGTTFQGLSINPEVRATVQSSLVKEVGDVLIGERGTRMRQRISELYLNYFTETGRESGTLSVSRKLVSDLEAKYSIAQRDLSDFDSDVAKLESALSRHANLIRPALRHSLEEASAEAQKAALGLGKAEATLSSIQSECQKTVVERKHAENLLGQRSRLVDDVRELSGSVAQLLAEREALHQEMARDEKIFADTIESAQVAETDEERARQAFSQAEAVLELAQVSDKAASLTARLQRAREFADENQKLELATGSCAISDRDLESLRSADRKVAESRAYVQATATRIEFHLTDSSEIKLDGEPLGERAAVLAVNSLDIEVGARGLIRVVPGGEELAARRSDWERAEKILAALLSKFGVSDVAHGADLVRQRRDAEARKTTISAILLELAPEGLDALDREYQETVARAASLREQLSEVKEATLVDAGLAVGTAKSRVAEATTKAAGLRQEAEKVRSALTKKQLTLAGKVGELGTAEKCLATAQANLKGARKSQSDEDVAEAAQKSLIVERDCQLRLQQLQENIERLDPEMIRTKVKTSQGAVSQLNNQIATIETEITGLRSRLEALGAKGLGELVGALEADLSIARIRLRAVEDEANALRVLHAVLKDAEKDANQIFLAPVVRRVQPYLNRISPGSQIQLKTDLSVEGLLRRGTVEPFECLSVGVREQISVITRIAFADMLAEKGVHAPIILDDALVYADERRFGDVLTTLAAAAHRHQIIILTCHEDRYVQLGCPINCIEGIAEPSLR